MKTKTLLSAICFLALLVTGCAKVDKVLYHAGPPKVIGTNVVTTPAYTDTNGVAHAASTNFVPVTVPGEIAPNTAIEGGINLVKVLPIPFAAPIAIALGWLYSAYASIRNKKALVAVVRSEVRALPKAGEAVCPLHRLESGRHSGADQNSR